jgi:LPS-assembly lipoprotein
MAGAAGLTRRTLFALASAAVLPGCGFRPMYATASDGSAGPAEAGLAQIEIGPMYERAGQLLRQALQERFERGGAGLARRYDLVVAYGLGAEGIAIQPDSSVTRIRLMGSARWTLTAQDPQRSTLATGTARSLDGYNILDEQIFAADLENETVQKRIAEAIADQITLQLAAYFNKHAGP